MLDYILSNYLITVLPVIDVMCLKYEKKFMSRLSESLLVWTIIIHTCIHIYKVKILFEDNYNFVFTFLVTDLILLYWKMRPEDVRKSTWIQFCTFTILTFLKAAFTVMNGRKSSSFDRESLYVCLYFGSLLPYFLYRTSTFLKVF